MFKKSIKSIFQKIIKPRIEFFDILFFFILFIIGIYISKDFGISWDESHHRHSGQKVLAYLVKFFGMDWIKPIPKGFSDFNYIEKMYGPIFDTTSAMIEEILQLNDMQNIFIMRHCLNFLFYFAGYIGFYIFIKSIFPKNKAIIILSLFYLFHPRLFGHGFFNPKDSILQAYIAISLIPITKSFIHFRFKYIMLSAITIGIAISTKIVSIYIPLIFSVCYFFIGRLRKIDIFIITKALFLFYIFLVFSIFIFWPPWGNPIKNIFDMFLILKQYPFPGQNFMLGEYVSRFNLPWFYIPLWVLITTPIPFIILFFIGIGKYFKHLVNKWTEKTIIDSFMMAGFLIPVLSIILLGSTLYGGWRHMFFIYPFLAYFMIKGFVFSIELIASRFKLKNKYCNLLFSIIVFSPSVFSIITMHPHQQVYFNILAGKNPMLNFEGDYWGNSYREGLEWIVQNDNRDSIMVSIHNSPGTRNRHMIQKKDRDRLNFQFISNPLKKEEIPGDYFITNFYGVQPDLYFKSKKKVSPFDNEVYSIKIGEMKILAIYKFNFDTN